MQAENAGVTHSGSGHSGFVMLVSLTPLDATCSLAEHVLW